MRTHALLGALVLAALAAAHATRLVQELGAGGGAGAAHPLQDREVMAAAKLLATNTEVLPEEKLSEISTSTRNKLIKMGETEEVKSKVAAGEIGAKNTEEQRIKAHGASGPPVSALSTASITQGALNEHAARVHAKKLSTFAHEEKGLKADYAKIQRDDAHAGKVLQKEMTTEKVKLAKKAGSQHGGGVSKQPVTKKEMAEDAALRKELAAIRKPEQIIIEKMKETSEKNILKQKAAAEKVIIDNAKQHAATVAALKKDAEELTEHPVAPPKMSAADKAKQEIAALMVKDGSSTKLKIGQILPNQE